jgi:beta-glucanase (GH16 family)
VLRSDPVLVWSDEFAETELDETKWVAAEGYLGHGTIMNVFEPSAISLRDGSLVVTTRSAPEYPLRPYVSGRIGTHGRFVRTFGRVEIRARFTRAPGIWYALWARPWTGPFPEIDFELLSRSAMQVYAVNHWAAPPLPADERRMYAVRVDVDFTQFHVYSVTWRPGLLEWKVDGAPMMRSTAQGVPQAPVGWMINAWVGGWSGGPTAETPVPSTFEVDYFRVYRDDGLLADPAIRLTEPRTSYARARDRAGVEVANFDEACFHVRMFADGALVETLAAPPWRFDLGSLTKGAHALRFVATDGVRSAEVSVDAQLD